MLPKGRLSLKDVYGPHHDESSKNVLVLKANSLAASLTRMARKGAQLDEELESTEPESPVPRAAPTTEHMAMKVVYDDEQWQKLRKDLRDNGPITTMGLTQILNEALKLRVDEIEDREKTKFTKRHGQHKSRRGSPPLVYSGGLFRSKQVPEGCDNTSLLSSLQSERLSPITFLQDGSPVPSPPQCRRVVDKSDVLDMLEEAMKMNKKP